jgi:RNA 2',3'-cyclic 3'-phosphodiesterase
MKRLFAAIAIEPGNDFIDTYMELQKLLYHERITWVGISNIHLTLKFFGETDESRIHPIVAALNSGSSTVGQFRLCFNKTGIFGSSYNPKVIWLGAEEQPALYKMTNQIKVELEKIGYKDDRQNFVPHLTLGRVRSVNDKQLFQDVMDDYRSAFQVEQLITSVHLYESVLRKRGPLYSKLYTISLKPQ